MCLLFAIDHLGFIAAAHDGTTGIICFYKAIQTFYVNLLESALLTNVLLLLLIASTDYFKVV